MFLTNMNVSRHGLDPTAILLVNFGFRRLSTARNQIWLVGFGVHAICLVRSQLHQVLNLTMRQRNSEQNELDHAYDRSLSRKNSSFPSMDRLRIFSIRLDAYLSVHCLSHPFP